MHFVSYTSLYFRRKPAKMASNQENGSQQHTGVVANNNQSLYLKYPVNSTWEMALSTGETVTGTVYCTDEVSNTVFLQKNLTHTTLATELSVVHASHIARSKSLSAAAAVNGGGGDESSASALLPKVQKKALEEREKRAIRIAEESLRHINEKVRHPKGRPIFGNRVSCGLIGMWHEKNISNPCFIPLSSFLWPLGIG